MTDYDYILAAVASAAMATVATFGSPHQTGFARANLEITQSKVFVNFEPLVVEACAMEDCSDTPQNEPL